MRHKLSGRQLSRNSPHRHALMRNMAGSLLRHETIRTTLPKAKELRRVVEPLITLGKSDSESNRRLAYSRLRDAAIVSKLFGDLGPRFRARPGGYTRILRMAPRRGDSAPMALMQFVERPAPVAAPEPATAAESKQGSRAAKGGAAKADTSKSRTGRERPVKAEKPAAAEKPARADKKAIAKKTAAKTGRKRTAKPE